MRYNQMCLWFEIMLIPNDSVMSDAIEAHMEENNQKVADPERRIGDYLVTQEFEEANKA
jgi:hypothetical protein